jgi:unspecific monooxygenase
VLARLRRDDPVHFIPEFGAWMVVRYDDVRQLFTDPNVTNDRRAYAGYKSPPEGSYMRWISENGLFSAPPDQHARMRKLASAAFTPGSVRRQEGQVRDVVEQFAAPIRGRTGIVDLIGEFTGPVPSTVICRITGVPPKGDDELRFRGLARDVISGISPLLDEAGQKRAENAILEMCEYVRELTVERRNAPQEDLISDMVLAQDEDDRMSNEEIVLMIAGLVSAGVETTAIGATMGLRSLFRNPDQLELLRKDRSLLPNAVNEILRYDFGPGGLPRYALRDFELRGKQVKKGQLLMLSFMGAHRDPAVFPDPDRFDVTRDTRDLTIFGHGPHYCLGANLARTELRCMFDAALDFLPPGASLREDLIEETRFGSFSRMETLPVEFA